MIGFVEGVLLETQEGQCIVKTEMGVGYSVRHPSHVRYLQGLSAAYQNQSRVSFWVHTHVREDALELFGFLTPQERDVFQSLLSVSGVGPKLALSLLSGMEPEALVGAITSASLDRLTGISGVGKKTAERLILELSDKWKKRFERAAVGMSLSGADDDVKLALGALGLRPSEIDQLIQKIQREPGVPTRKEEWIKRALQMVRN